MVPAGDSTVNVGPETETARGWSYEVTLRWPDRIETQHTVTLSWVDHDLIAGGRFPPSRTVEAAMNLILDVGEEVIGIGDVPDRFDLSRLRRLVADFDDGVRARL